MPSWKGKSRGGSFGYRFFIFLIGKLGIRFAYFFLIFVVVHFIPFAPLATRSNWQYFRKVRRFGWLKTVRMMYVNYYRFGQVIIDKVAVRSGLERKYKYEFERYDEFLQTLNGGTGVIMIGAHVGNWEIGGTFFGDYARKINIVMYDAEYQRIKNVLDENLKQSAHKIIPISDANFEHIYQIKDALDRKEYVCFQGDRFVADKGATTADFFGKPANFPKGVFHLAAKWGVPVVFYFSMREKGMRYRFKFYHAKIEKGAEKADKQLIRQYIKVLEEVLTEYPEQWFNYYKFWNV